MNRFDIQGIWNEREIYHANTLLDGASHDEQQARALNDKAWENKNKGVWCPEMFQSARDLTRQSEAKRREAFHILEATRERMHTAASDATCAELKIYPDA